MSERKKKEKEENKNKNTGKIMVKMYFIVGYLNTKRTEDKALNCF